MKLKSNVFLKYVAAAIACIASGMAGAHQAQAGVTMYTSQASFSAQGTIAFNSTFSDFGTGFSFPGDPFTRGDVTYTSPFSPGNSDPTNLIIGTGTGYSPITNLMGSNWWSPVTGDINAAPKYDMFGYDIGVLNRQDRQTLVVTTNVGSYSFGPLTLVDAARALEFRGFITDSPTEYFTGFSITAEFGDGSLPGITDVQVGNTGIRPEGVPEPGSLIVFGALGAIGMVVGYRRRQQVA